VLRHRGENVQRESCGRGIVHRNELTSAVHEVRQEGDVARRAIKAGNHQHCARELALLQGRGERWAI
jgi:hypothetical protein